LVKTIWGPLQRAVVGTIVFWVIAGASAVLAEVKIEHNPVKKARSGNRIELGAEIKDKKAQIKEVRAYFKSGYDSRFWFAPMRSNGKRYVAVLPAPALGAETVQYRLYAVNGKNEFVKTDLFTIRIEDDEQALARLEAKEPTSVDLDLDEIEHVRDLARGGGEPDPSQRVEVRNDVPGSQAPADIPGFQDYIVMAEASPAAAGAGLGAASSVGVGGGIGTGTILGGAAVLGGVAVAAGEGGGGGDGNKASTPPADRVVQCDNLTQSGSNTPETIAVELAKRSGTFGFSWEMFGIKDRMIVRYQGSVLHDTGCVSGNGRISRNYSGSQTAITVEVIPNCEGTTGTSWNFTVACP